jgi:hypothetical protein
MATFKNEKMGNWKAEGGIAPAHEAFLVFSVVSFVYIHIL